MSDNQKAPLLYISFLLTLLVLFVANFLFIYQPIQQTITRLTDNVLTLQSDIKAVSLRLDALQTQGGAAGTPTTQAEVMADEPPQVIAHEESTTGAQPYQTVSLGDANGKTVAITTFEDPLCTWCGVLWREIMPAVFEQYKDVRFQVTHRLTSMIGGESSEKLSKFAYCAGELLGPEVFHRYMNTVYTTSSNDPEVVLADVVDDEAKRKDVLSCVEQGRWSVARDADSQAFRRFRISGTPALYIDGVFIGGADREGIVREIERALGKQ